MMRNRNFCWCSFASVAVVITVINYFILKLPKIEDEYIGNLQPISFDALKSDASGLYKIWPLFITRTRNVKDSIDITIITQSSVSNLPDIERLVRDWDGPVSVGVFAPGSDIEIAVKVLYTMKVCNQAVRSNVIFSLVLALSHPPKYHHDLSVYLHKIKSNPPVCKSFLSFDDILQSKTDRNYENQAVPYPVNLLRNVALENVRTSHVFVIDIDMSPSANLRKSFQKEYLSIKRENGVYVIPTFELEERIEIPSTKKELLDLWSLGKARPFYETVCWKCQKYTDYNKWMRTSSKTLSVVYKVDWKDPWEPFFIAESNRIVHYDERFKQYGFNRISQVCEMHISGYDFYILDNAYLIHHGLKDKSIFHSSKDAENSLNRDLYRTFKTELRSKYHNSKRHC